MKGNFPRLILALLIAVAVFAVLRTRELTPPSKPPAQSGASSRNETGSETRASATIVRPAASAKPVEPAARAPASLRSPAELFSELFRRGEWNISRGPDGRPTGLSGTPILGATADARSALDFARTLARQLGANPEHLSEAHSKADTATGLQTMYKYEQWIGDHPVFGGSLSVLSRRMDAAAYLVNSSLKTVDEAPGPGINRAQAEAIVLSIYKDRGGKIATPLFSNAYVYADLAPVELAWYFMVSVTKPAPMKLRVLLGATTKGVLYEGNALLN